jgi:hypothetical protein
LFSPNAARRAPPIRRYCDCVRAIARVDRVPNLVSMRFAPLLPSFAGIILAPSGAELVRRGRWAKAKASSARPRPIAHRHAHMRRHSFALQRRPA